MDTAEFAGLFWSAVVGSLGALTILIILSEWQRRRVLKRERESGIIPSIQAAVDALERDDDREQLDAERRFVNFLLRTPANRPGKIF